MKATYWQRSESLDYVNKTDKVIEANSIVDLKTRIAVTGTSINPNETGSIHVTGVYKIKKKEGEEITFAANVYFNATDGITTTADGNTPAGCAAEDATAEAEYILVRLLG